MRRHSDPLRIVALLLIAGGAVAWLRSGEDVTVAAVPCADGHPTCTAGSEDAVTVRESGAVPSEGGATAPSLEASDFCTNVGYLCAELADSDAIRLQRWKDFDGTVVVHVPPPEGLSGGAARELQRAAARGVRAWNDQPFPILVDLRGDRNPHFAIRWEAHAGTRLGVTRTSWSPATGLVVDFIELGMLRPAGAAGAADPRQVRLTAAHEMGHALGLPHSDSPRDVMYPTNTATSMSARDYRSVEVLYGVPDGTSVRR